MPLAPFFIATLALNLAPGPDMTYVAARSLGQGRRAGLVSAIGISAGCVVHIVAASIGVAALLRAWPSGYSAIRLTGAAYLIYLGIVMWRSAARGAAMRAVTPASDGAIFRQGAVTNILNPKVAMFFLAFLPQFIDPARGPAGLQTLALGLAFNVCGTLVNVAVAWLAGSARTLLESRGGRAWFQRTSAAILAVLGLRLALAQ
jgi:threonine/homoserine/homoserine lactone efflux protein